MIGAFTNYAAIGVLFCTWLIYTNNLTETNKMFFKMSD